MIVVFDAVCVAVVATVADESVSDADCIGMQLLHILRRARSRGVLRV